jgi:hypothetical protein
MGTGAPARVGGAHPVEHGASRARGQASPAASALREGWGNKGSARVAKGFA